MGMDLVFRGKYGLVIFILSLGVFMILIGQPKIGWIFVGFGLALAYFLVKD